MLETALPKVIEPLKLVEQRIDLKGTVAIDQCERLKQCLVDSCGDIQVSLCFGKDEQGLRIITGSLRADVRLQCQRCLQPFEFCVEGQINLAIARNEDVFNSLPRVYDPLLLEGPELQLWPLIEEELLLGLPIVAKHPEDQCRADFSYEGQDEQLQQSKPNPFSVLAKLKNQK